MDFPNKILIIGLGSIAQKHCQAIQTIFTDSQVFFVSASGRSQGLPDNGYSSIEEALQRHEFDFAIIASPASLHVTHCISLLSQVDIPLLIEKPLADTSHVSAELVEQYRQSKLKVAYCLRHHTGFLTLKSMLKEIPKNEWLSIDIEVGQHLAQWRPNKDYRESVTARHSLGGGALLELSHELDYAVQLLGPLTLQHASRRHSGLLEIDPQLEDSADLYLTTENQVPVRVHVDLLQKRPVRFCRVLTRQHVIELDWVNNQVWQNGELIDKQPVSMPAGYIYQQQLACFWQCVSEQFDSSTSAEVIESALASLEQGNYVLALVDEAKQMSPVIKGNK